MNELKQAQALINHKANHDIRASLAILAGFSQALDSTFSELASVYAGIAKQAASAGGHVDGAEQVQGLEAECRFFLSRLGGSIDQLKSRLNNLEST